MSNNIIIVAGGSGSRMNAGIPKQFIELAGKPILMHTIEKFYSANLSVKIIVVLPENEVEKWKELCAKNNFKIKHEVVAGGETRFHSVKNGLERAGETGVTGIHDGVRPLVSAALINKCFSEAAKNGNAVPCIPVTDSIRTLDGNQNRILSRDAIVKIQTPQCFSSALLKKAYKQDYKNLFTDDASVVEATGEKINLIEGEESNIKITFPIDLDIANVLLKGQ